MQPRPRPISLPPEAQAKAGIWTMLGAELTEQDGGRQNLVSNCRGVPGGRSLAPGQVPRVEGHLGRVLGSAPSGQMVD